ncbi:Archaemetzincin-1 [Orbilia ellipsospora]|uniref:Archaemetzincin-1 n=1 Tax=Orbilia ellipsospora TaxID=2528407 RepID=A0AAV9WXA3_9PEZI
MPPKKKRPCCTTLQLECSPNAAKAGYNRPAETTLRTATTFSRKPSPSATTATLPQTTFPAPLILPGDDLSSDPRYPPQSLTRFKRLPERNPITYPRLKLYTLTLPTISPDTPEFESWTLPIDPDTKSPIEELETPSPSWSDVESYLIPFFDPLEVTPFPSPITITKWTRSQQSSSTSIINMALSTTSPRKTLKMRVRKTPTGNEACYTHQLNLSDILDFAIEILPTDAYAIIVFANHDLYEDKDDDFCIGRAFGGSRVCVVSSARYHPVAEWVAGIGAEELGGEGHDWPGSHCKEFVEKMCQEDAETGKKKKGKVERVGDELGRTPMYRAISAHTAELASISTRTAEHNQSLWLSRVCKTASHELLHCFGVDHCVYYACAMQGTASIIEDTRQPFYLCPVDQAKLKDALTGKDKGIGDVTREEWELGWCVRMKGYCDGVIAGGVTLGWRSIAGWLKGRIEELQGIIEAVGDGGGEGTHDNPIHLD